MVMMIQNFHLIVTGLLWMNVCFSRDYNISEAKDGETDAVINEGQTNH